MSKKLKNIICLGGGNAMPKAVLAGLKKYPVNLSVICAMLDSGASAGREREIYKTNISFGDIRRAFLALSGASQDVKDAFNVRFKNGPYAGAVVANILGTAVAKEGDYEKALRVYGEVFKISSRYHILPSTLDDATLYAELENGQIIKGEANIDVPKHNSKISKVYLKPKPGAYPEAVEAIKKADLIIIGPGDLYSSLMQILLIDGISAAINKSKAKKVYICNIMTKKGETDGFSVLDFTNEIEKYLKGRVDFIIHNNKEGNVRINDDLKNNKKFIGKNLLKSGTVEHNPNKLAKIILKLCKL
ncbi:MAG: gluconeogenesis factor YvcK family protein [Patescibacteria group bacterium]